MLLNDAGQFGHGGHIVCGRRTELAMDADTARAVSPDIRRMIGYSIHPPFVGAVNGMHPQRLLDE